MYYVYAIYNKDNDRIYTGQTKDIKLRLELHNNHALGGYTSKYLGEWVLVFKEECNSRQLALLREKQLKSYRGREFIKLNIPR